MKGVERRTLAEWAATITYRVTEAVYGAGGVTSRDERYQAIYLEVYHGVKLAQAEARKEVRKKMNKR